MNALEKPLPIRLRGTIQICAIASMVAITTGCVSEPHVVFNRETQRVAPLYGPEEVPCYGSLDIYHSGSGAVGGVGAVAIGVLGLAAIAAGGSPVLEPGGSAGGGVWYGIFFKKPVDSTNDFYFKTSKEKVYHGFLETRGTVVLDGRSVHIDIEYKDAKGSWIKAPFNGLRKISKILPDDVLHPAPKSPAKQRTPKDLQDTSR